jgi:AcrR family transcriptional regulator
LPKRSASLAPTVYDYFPGKDGILDALYQEGTERLLRDFQDAMGAHDPGLAQLRAIGAAYRDFAHAEPDLFQLIFGRAEPAYRPNEEIKSRSADLFALLVEVTARAIEVGDLRPADPKAVALAAWAAVHGFVTLEINGYLRDCSPLDADETFQASLQVLFGGLRA